MNVQVWTAPAINDAGTLFVASRYNGTMYAIDTRRGDVQWTAAIGCDVYSSPVLHGGMVVFGADDGKLHALSQSDGAVAWELVMGVPLLHPVRASPAVTRDGHVVVQGWSSLVCVRVADGSEVWVRKNHAASVSGVTVDRDGQLFTSTLQQEVVHSNPIGVVVGSFRCQSPLTSTPVVGPGGRVYVGGDSRLYALQ